MTAAIEHGVPAAPPTRRDAATRLGAVRYATVGGLQRVRAFMRVTRSAKAPAWCGAVRAASSARRILPGGRRDPAGLWFDGGGPSRLTEDRQKPSCRKPRSCCGVFRRTRSDGWHGTRITVPSRARIEQMLSA